ncbi:hypothetical protein BJV74DRAFT_168830 [Russula compacta]|nr:hypothetical protein BJV74DRAFT_168830 [Russula compacta]
MTGIVGDSVVVLLRPLCSRIGIRVRRPRSSITAIFVPSPEWTRSCHTHLRSDPTVRCFPRGPVVVASPRSGFGESSEWGDCFEPSARTRAVVVAHVMAMYSTRLDTWVADVLLNHPMCTSASAYTSLSLFRRRSRGSWDILRLKIRWSFLTFLVTTASPSLHH